MGRAGRYTLSVMAWVAAFAGWSSLVGLVVAAVTGEEATEVGLGTSALTMVLVPAVPTLVALWFNDWARDGFPTREQRKARREAPREVPVVIQHPVHVEPAIEEAAPAPSPARTPPRTAPRTPPRPPRPAGALPVVDAHPLGVPAATPRADAPEGAFPVAPLLRDRD